MSTDINGLGRDSSTGRRTLVKKPPDRLSGYSLIKAVMNDRDRAQALVQNHEAGLERIFESLGAKAVIKAFKDSGGISQETKPTVNWLAWLGTEAPESQTVSSGSFLDLVRLATVQPSVLIDSANKLLTSFNQLQEAVNRLEKFNPKIEQMPRDQLSDMSEVLLKEFRVDFMLFTKYAKMKLFDSDLNLVAVDTFHNSLPDSVKNKGNVAHLAPVSTAFYGFVKQLYGLAIRQQD